MEEQELEELPSTQGRLKRKVISILAYLVAAFFGVTSTMQCSQLTRGDTDATEMMLINRYAFLGWLIMAYLLWPSLTEKERELLKIRKKLAAKKAAENLDAEFKRARDELEG